MKKCLSVGHFSPITRSFCSSRNRVRNPEKLPHIESWDPKHEKWDKFWPTPQTFSDAIPLHLTQGVPNALTAPEYKSTTEMLKIPNFFHLTPAHVKKQCQKLKDLCTKFPAVLTQPESARKHFPVTTIYKEFIFNSPSVRHKGSNTVTLEVSVSALKLDDHGLDKFRRLCEDKFDPKTGILTLTSSKCPTRKQNYDYLRYVLSVLYIESMKVDKWETEDKVFEDNETFEWGQSQSARNMETLKEIISVDGAVEQSHSSAVTDLYTQGESEATLRAYGDSVLKIYGKE